MRKIYFFFLLLVAGVANAQSIDIVANSGSTSAGPFGTSNYAAGEYIYTETELGGPGNFVTAGSAINMLGFSVNTVGSTTTFNNVNIYLKNVSSATSTFTNGTYTTAGYTLVYSGSITLSATGFTEISLNTPFTRTAGSNLQMLVERTDAVTHINYLYNSANGNNTSSAINTCRRYNGTTALSGSTTLTVSSFRAAIRVIHRYQNDIRPRAIYTLGKLPVPNGAPTVISANIFNEGSTAPASVDVTLTVTGANSFTNTKTVTIGGTYTSTNVVFDAFNPTNIGTNTVTVSVNADDYSSNNALSVTQSCNPTTWSYAYGTASSGGVGFTNGTGDFVAKFSTTLSSSISQVTTNFFSGGQPYQIGIWAADGAGGTPGTNLWTSSTLTSSTGVNVIPVSPAVNVNTGNFYVGVRQTGTTNVSFAYQTETPIRPSTFYFTSPTGGTTWTDFAPGNSFRFMIEPKLILNNDASLTAYNLNLPSTSLSCLGSNNPTVVINNVGQQPILPGAATITLKRAGANSNLISLTNSTTINTGGNELITFNGANSSNPGTTFDTVYITYPIDDDKTTDTLKTSYFTTPTIFALPAIETAELATLPVFAYTSLVSGSRNLLSLQTGNYTNPDLTAPLAPHGGTKFYLFDDYGGTTSSGIISRLYSNCISLPAAAPSSCPVVLSFWMSHDASFSTALDSLYISVSTDKGATWNRFTGSTERFGRYDASATTPTWRKETIDLSAYAGQTIQLAFDNVSKYGNVIGLDDITIGTNSADKVDLATNSSNGVNLVKSCDDAGWTYYVDPASPNKNVLAIQWDPSNTGANTTAKANALPRIQLDAAPFAAEDIPNKKATYTMKRYWNVNLNGNTMTAPVNLRFFYTAAEKTEVDNAATTFATTNAGTLETPNWFKTITGDFAGDAAHVNADKVLNATHLNDVNTSAATINGVLYAQFNGITSFSGGTYAAGVGSGNTLPIGLLNFSGERAGTVNRLRWTTSTEQNNKGFEVQRSSDGINYVAIGFVNTLATAGNSSTALSYSYLDNSISGEKQYYRLRQIDLNNLGRLSTIVVIHGPTAPVVKIDGLFPNPASESINVLIASPARNQVTLQVLNVAGSVMIQRIVSLETGSNTIPLDISSISKGTYVVKIIGSNTMGENVRKFVKQ